MEAGTPISAAEGFPFLIVPNPDASLRHTSVISVGAKEDFRRLDAQQRVKRGTAAKPRPPTGSALEGGCVD